MTEGQSLYIGLDVGGTNIKAVLVDSDAQILADNAVPTQAKAGPEAVMAQMDELTRDLVEQADNRWSAVRAIGIGVAAWMNLTEGIVLRAPNLTGWVDIPLRQQMSECWQRSVLIENDANAAAWGEYVAGAGRGAHSMVLLTLGTGIGGGVIIDDKLVHGYTDTGGELGHMVIVDDGPECVCGNHGCLEALASGPGTVRRFVAAMQQWPDSILADKARAGELITAKDIYQHARAGDQLSREILRDTGRLLGIGVHNIIVAFNPQRVVLAGGMMAAGDLIIDPVKAEVKRRTFPYAVRCTEICWAELGTIAGALGAAGCATQQYPPACP